MSELAVTLFARVGVELDRQELTEFRTHKVRALLVLLASEPQTPQRRERLMELLWPGMPESSARQNLRQVLFHLRRAIPDLDPVSGTTAVPALLSDRQTIRLNPAAAISTDTVRFDALLAQVRQHSHVDLFTCPICYERLNTAVALYTGDFLADFYLDDSNEFEDWAAARRQVYQREVLDALETLTTMAMRRQAYAVAQGCAERQLALDNLRESAYRQLMEILALNGRRSEALALYDTCRRALAEELGMAPTARTTELAERIRAGESHLAVEQLPGGTITFLFTDVAGSTRLWQQYPQQMAVALREHDRILRQAIEEQGGYVFKTAGDAFYGAFQTAPAALAAALAAQRGLAAAEWPEGMPALQARMGLHSGAADEREGDYFGPALNRVARLMSVGQGGQVLVSSATAYLLRDNPPEGVSLRDLGRHRLKDLPEPETIFQLVAPGLADQFAPLQTGLDRKVVLPVKATPFLGRERELKEATALLSRPEVRLLTLTGVGGTGKTRLALQMAAVLADSFADGTIFVDLSPVSDWTRVADTILAALDTPARSEEAPERMLESYLGDRALLLVLDNFEQVIAAATLVGNLLQAAPRLTIVVTSRERLNIYGEVIYAVPPLGLPDPGTAVSLESAARSEAVALFVSRARAARQDFVLDEANVDDVIELCRRLDGLPLAIELAAARSRLFTPAVLRQRLQQMLGTTSGGLRDLPQRQQTLRGAIGWSYDLLSADEQQLFRRLAVFHGGRSLEAAETVCGPGLELAVWEGLESLFDKSLLFRAEGPFGEPRFVMLETIQEYAGAALESSGEAEVLRERHAAYFHDLVARTAPGLRGAHSRELIMRLQPEQENIRTALGWYLDGGDVEQGAAMAAVLSDFWLYSYGHREAAQWLGRALGLQERVSASTRAAVLTAASKVALYRQRLDEGRAYGREALALAQELDEKSAIAWAMIWLAASYHDLPALFDEGLRLAVEGVRLFKELGLDAGISQGLNIEGELLRYIGRLAEAEAAYKELIPIAQATGEVRREVMQYANLAMIAYERRNEVEILNYALACLPIALENAIGDIAVVALELIAVVLHWHGQHEPAATLIGAAQAWYERTATVTQPGDHKIEKHIMAEVRSGLDEDAYARALQAGSRLTLQDAVDIAVAEVRRLEEEGGALRP